MGEERRGALQVGGNREYRCMIAYVMNRLFGGYGEDGKQLIRISWCDRFIDADAYISVIEVT